MINVDFHIHSKYSGGTSGNMEIPVIAEQSIFKGLNTIGSGDCLNKNWLDHFVSSVKKVDEGTFEHKSGIRFILTTEVEDYRRVHHVILFPSLSAVQEFRDTIKDKSPNLDTDGRCNINLAGDELLDIVSNIDGLIGPSHAFTPWTSIYKEYNSLEECYKTKNIPFLELGLSADTQMADCISELKNVTFMTNSDAHSPWPHRIGREFNRLKVKDNTYDEIINAIKRRGGNEFVLNVGIDPDLGKYHMTACTRCYKKYSWDKAKETKYRCTCGGLIKKGVVDRINELHDQEVIHPPHRPRYIKTIPLAEILVEALGLSSVNSKKVQDLWKLLVESFKNEINVLIVTPKEEIERIAGEKVAQAIIDFREGKIYIEPGGGGMYGKAYLNKKNINQSSLDGYL
ncbi:MAG TPA: TIGR00375 family protein [Methanofastidiosum sp.]|nr:TIGR00375 family protein [Methanofastidiosum sp.]HNZ87078.1 TIGR00375 family protein [Methanofastidiosum sp.]HOC78141.1 TIGR00375 family protein [Methanofastidiosum sp.]HOG73673.1 TIGR00375 family protein [Methanofastidiosum sp.]HPA49482.1 TIGR00375 family protein [Methanofastidiosum sp.]